LALSIYEEAWRPLITVDTTVPVAVAAEVRRLHADRTG